MSESIQIGDLVVVARPPAHSPSCGIGHIFAVTAIRQRAGNLGGGKYSARCSFCGWRGTRGQSAASLVAEGSPIANGIPLGRLKRIPPLEELQTYRNTDENPIKVTL